MKDITVVITTAYDLWSIEVMNPEFDRVLYSDYWSHHDSESGVGGEKRFAKLLEYLGHQVEVQDTY